MKMKIKTKAGSHTLNVLDIKRREYKNDKIKRPGKYIHYDD